MIRRYNLIHTGKPLASLCNAAFRPLNPRVIAVSDSSGFPTKCPHGLVSNLDRVTQLDGCKLVRLEEGGLRLMDAAYALGIF